jgi:hypothetical protein
MKFLRLLYASLREIFEESAFERFCRREGVSADRASYNKFLREQQKVKKLKCC